MAIVFISPKDKEKVFILGIAGLFVLILAIIGLIVFFKKPKKIAVEDVFRAPKIKINFDILKLDKIKELELLPEIEKEFNYEAQTAQGEPKSGKISAPSPEKATQLLWATPTWLIGTSLIRTMTLT